MMHQDLVPKDKQFMDMMTLGIAAELEDTIDEMMDGQMGGDRGVDSLVAMIIKKLYGDKKDDKDDMKKSKLLSCRGSILCVHEFNCSTTLPKG